MILRWALLLFLLSSGPSYAKFCISPVENGTPAGESEVNRTYNMVHDTLALPQFPNLIVARTSARAIHTIRNGRFEELDAAFPNRIYDRSSDHFNLLPDGRLIGYDPFTISRTARSNREIYVLHPDTAEFVGIEGTAGFLSAYFDKETGIFRFVTSQGALMDLGADGPVASTLPQLDDLSGQSTAVPRYVPQLGGYLAAGSGSFWFLADDAAQWARIHDVTEAKWSFRLPTTRIVINEAEGLMHFSLHLDLLTFDITRSVPQLIYRVENVSSWASVGGQVIAEQDQFGWTIWGDVDRFDHRWPDLWLLTRDGPQPVPGLPVATDQSDPLGGYRLKPTEYDDMVLLFVDDILMKFDGQQVSPMSAQSPQPKHLVQRSFGDRTIWNNNGGIFELDPEYGFRELPLPDDIQRVSHYYYSSRFKGAFVTDAMTDTVWFTDDLVNYGKVGGGRGGVLVRVVADLPADDASLAYGPDGLWFVRPCVE